ncbi:nodulation protein NfeD [Phenylobacterium sp. LjRoot225]|uniref:NfeD family protein n=1 Tax=Phenylobacterium sp. LjRoot225 TaxID=3342285 RepID=UPI003ECF510B
MFLLLLLALGFASATAPAAPQGGRVAVVLTIDGAIGPASADYFKRGLAGARTRGAAIVVLQLDTPGGLDASMREMIRQLIASPVPVAVYVAPGGARAASAGTYILYASHIAAMAPGTNLGAATPIQIGLPGILPGNEPEGQDRKPAPGADEGRRPAKDDQARAPAAASQTDAKAINDAVAYIRALAHLRGRNADWGERAVREAASVDASDALAAGVIDFIARDVADVLAQADGRAVTVGDARLVLRTRGLVIEQVRPDWRHQLLAAIANPNLALVLMMIGVYGLLFEFMNPGALFPGVIGVISLLVALYGLAVLPVNYAGLALILVGMGLMVAEALAPSFGILGIGGAAAFLLGGMILIDSEAPGVSVSLPLVAGLAVVSLAFSLVVVRLALTARRRRVVSGREEMIGCPGVVQTWSDGVGYVFAHSERWRAVSDAPLRTGDRVRVVAIENLTLTVAPENSVDRP